MTNGDDRSRGDDPSDRCDRARLLMTRGTRSAEEERELSEHVGLCAACTSLAADDAALARALSGRQAEPDLSALFSSVERSVAAEQGAGGSIRALPTRTRVILASAAAATIVMVAGLLRPRVDLPVYPRLRLALELCALVAGAALAGWLWLRPLYRSPLPRWVAPSVALGCLLVPWLLAALPAAHQQHPASLAGTGDDLVRRAAACLAYGGAWGAALMILLRALGRASGATPAFVSSAGLAGALVGVFCLHLHCPLTSPIHLLAGHAPIPLLLASLLVARSAWKSRPS